jgi:hypothetical protein
VVITLLATPWCAVLATETGIRVHTRAWQWVAEDAQHDAATAVAVPAVQPPRVGEQHAFTWAEPKRLQVLRDDGAQDRDGGGRLGGEPR